MSSQNLTINISFGTVAKTAFFLILLWALYQLLDLVLVVLTAVVIASAIEPATKWFVKYRIPRVIAVILIYVAVVVFLSSIFYFLVPPLLDDLRGVAQKVPAYIDTIREGTFLSTTTGSLGQDLEDVLSVKDAIASVVDALNRLTDNFLRVVSTVFGGVFSLLLIVVISFYLAVQEKGIEKFLDTITPVKHEAYVINLWHRSQNKIALWLRGQLLLALIIGVLVYLGLTVFGIKYAFLLALVAAVFELIPIFGPILAAVPAVGVALLEGGATSALIVIVLYTIIQQFENQLIYPLVVKQVVGVPPIIAIIAIVAGGTLAGLLGIILSIPLAAIMMELFNDLDKEKHHLRERKSAV